MLLIAHRGDTINHKENTTQAFLSAFEKGADGIELDVHLHDGKVIVVHNFLFDRSIEYPLLSEVLAEIHDKGRIEIEVKEHDSTILSPLKTILDKYPKSEFELTTSEVPLAPHIKDNFPNLLLGLIMRRYIFEDWMTPELVASKIIGWGKMAGANVLHIPQTVLSRFGGKSLVSQIHAADLRVHIHIPKSENEATDLQIAVSWNIDQCTLDNVGLIAKLGVK